MPEHRAPTLVTLLLVGLILVGVILGSGRYRGLGGPGGSLNPFDTGPPPVDINRDVPLMGAWLGAWPNPDNAVIANYTSKVGQRPEIVDVYSDWRTPPDNISWEVGYIMSQGVIPQITWEPQGYTTPQIVNGTAPVYLQTKQRMPMDAYVDAVAKGVCQQAKDHHQVLLVRMLHEMNGGWYSWGISYQDKSGHYPNTDRSYIAAWRHLHDIFRAHCSDQYVRFVWNPNQYSKGRGASFTGAYPGDAYVDYVGLDGYNWGTQASWGWQSFDTIFRPVYCNVTHNVDKPVLISEWASAEKGGNKSAWVQHTLDEMVAGRYPRVVGMVYFDQTKHEQETGTQLQWAFDSSSSSLAAFVHGVKALEGSGVGAGPSICTSGSG